MFLVNCADDRVLLSLLYGSQQADAPALRDVVEWCDDQGCNSNRFKKTLYKTWKTTIHDQEVEIVTKYLGTMFDNKLRWGDNTQNIALIVHKCQQRLYFLRKVNKFSVTNPF